MQFGVHLLQVGHLGTRDNLLAFAQRAEELGFHSLWASDHVVIPRHIAGEYAGGGRFPVPPDMPFLEPFSLLSFVAAATQRILLGTSVIVLPMRNPIVTAKEVATLDVLSGGRVIFGVGAGWMAEEFEALGVPFRGHGPRTDEYLEAVRRLWTEEDPSFRGRYVRVEGIGFAPKPLQKPHPPIWVGGMSEGALRRAGRYGDAWHATGTVDPDVLARCFARVQEHARQAGRDPSRILFSVRADRFLRGEPDQVLSVLESLRRIGVAHVLTAFPAPTIDESLEQMERFARQVVPALA